MIVTPSSPQFLNITIRAVTYGDQTASQDFQFKICQKGVFFDWCPQCPVNFIVTDGYQEINAYLGQSADVTFVVNAEPDNDQCQIDSQTFKLTEGDTEVELFSTFMTVTVPEDNLNQTQFTVFNPPAGGTFTMWITYTVEEF